MRYSRARNLALFTKIARLDDDINRRLGIGKSRGNEPPPLFQTPIDAQLESLLNYGTKYKGPNNVGPHRIHNFHLVEKGLRHAIDSGSEGQDQLNFLRALGDTRNDNSLMDIDPTIMGAYAQAMGAIPRNPIGGEIAGEQLGLDLDARQGLLARVTDALEGPARKTKNKLTSAGNTALALLGDAGTSISSGAGKATSAAKALLGLGGGGGGGQLLLGHDPSVGLPPNAGAGGGPDFDVSGLNFGGILDGMGGKIGKGLGIAALLAAAGYGGKKYYDSRQAGKALAAKRAREEEEARAALAAAQLSAEQRRKLMRNIGIGAAATAGLGLGAYGYSRRNRD